MKKIVALLFTTLCFYSCKEVWNEDDKTTFKTTCMQEAQQWAGNEQIATDYCNCVLEKIIKKYPHETDALEHLEQLSKDTTFRSCRDGVLVGK